MLVRKQLPHVLIVLVILLVAACDTASPPPPEITVVITAVDDTAALADGVAQALTGTAQVYVAATETELAYQGIHPTDTLTPTPSITFTPAPTHPVTPTRTPTATITLTPTFAPFPTNTPAAIASDSVAFGWVRILNASRQRADSGLDIYINDVRIARSLVFRGQTVFQQVPAGAVRISLQNVDAGFNIQPGQPAPPALLSTVIEVTPGAAVSMVISDDVDRALRFTQVQEDSSPLPSGKSRITVVQVNPFLIDSNVLVPNTGRSLGYDVKADEIVGPMDVPPGSYPIEFYDALQPDQLYARLDQIELANRIGYLLVMVAPELESTNPTDFILYTSPTRRVETDLGIRFVNSYSLPVTTLIDGQVIFRNLGVGSTSPAIPVSRLGSSLLIQTALGEKLYEGRLGPWQGDTTESDKIELLYPNPNPVGGTFAINITEFPQDAPPTAIRANVRLIHALPGTVGLSLQIRPAASVTQGDTAPAWVTIAGAAQLEASPYAGRTAGLYDFRVVLQGTDTNTIFGSASNVELLAGGLYDFVIAPGTEVGKARLEILQPEVQFTAAGINEGDPKVVAEAVGATLTALAPAVTVTPTTFFTPTFTISPVPTNTPRPSNTPNVPPPSVVVIPAPPNTVMGTLSINGLGFAPGLTYVITLDDGTTPLVRDRIADDGTLGETISLPAGIQPGWHTLVVCVDCRAGGRNQQAVASIQIASPDMTPTLTPAP